MQIILLGCLMSLLLGSELYKPLKLSKAYQDSSLRVNYHKVLKLLIIKNSINLILVWVLVIAMLIDTSLLNYVVWLLVVLLIIWQLIDHLFKWRMHRLMKCPQCHEYLSNMTSGFYFKKIDQCPYCGKIFN